MTPSGPKSCITVRSLKFHSKKGPKVWYFTLNKFLDTIFQQSLVAIFFLDKWNVEADSESLLKNLKLLPYSISMPDHSIKLYFTGSKVIQILEYLWAHIYTFTLKNTAYSQLNKEKMACLTQIFWNTHLGVTCIGIRICINIYDSFTIEGCAGFSLTMP